MLDIFYKIEQKYSRIFSSGISEVVPSLVGVSVGSPQLLLISEAPSLFL